MLNSEPDPPPHDDDDGCEPYSGPEGELDPNDK